MSGKTEIKPRKEKKAVKVFWSDFKAFISKGSIADLAVAVVIGAAFNKIVTGFVNFVINPFVGIFIKHGSLDSLKTVITPAADAVTDEAGAVITPAVTEVAILWGTWMQTIIDFLITAFCVFVLLRIIIKSKAKLEAKKTAEENAKAEAARAEAAKVAEAAALKQAEYEASVRNQEVLLSEIRDLLKENAKH